MLPCLPRLANFFILACIMGSAHCVATEASSPREQLPPDSDFVLTEARFEERRDGRTLWRGTGARARGDVGHMQVDQLRLTKIEVPGEAAWTLDAVGADLDFKTDMSHFAPVRLLDGTGHVLTAATGTYNAAAGTFDLTAPLTLTSPGLTARAASARVDLRTHCVDVAGPVEGTFSQAPFTL